MTDPKVIEAQEEMTRVWLTALLQTLHLTDGPRELTYWKTTVELDNGARYLLSFQHVSGPKIELAERPPEKT